MAIIRLDYDGMSKTWLMTAYDDQVGRSARRSTGRPGDSADTSSASPTSTNIQPDGLADKNTLAFRHGGGMAGEGRRPATGIAKAAAEGEAAAVRLKDAIDALIAGVDPAAVRQGRFGGARGAEGIYKPKSGVVRLRTTQDFEVLAHELGHHVEVRVGAPVKTWMKANKAVLDGLAYPGAAKGVITKEGFAETIRHMVTNPAYLDAQAPGLRASLAAVLQQHDPALLATLGEATRAYRDWRLQPSGAAVSSTIVTARKPGPVARALQGIKSDFRNTVAEWVGAGYAALVDDLHPIHRAVRGLVRIAGENSGARIVDLRVGADAYKLARMSRGGFQAGHADIMHGVVPYGRLEPASASLRDAIVAATGGPNVLGRLDEAKLKDFGTYLWSRRALGEWERFDAGAIPNPPDKLTRGDHLVNASELEAANPQFAAAADQVHNWARALWTKKFHAGLITKEQWEDGLRIKDYVPGLRHFDDSEAGGGSGMKGGKDGRKRIVNRFEGSDRDVINPLESLVADAYETASAIARNDSVRALAKLADIAGNGAGAIAERIPARELRATMVNPLEAIETAAKRAGMSKADIVAVRDLLEGTIGSDAVPLFRPAMISPKGEPIVFFREGGEIRALRLADGKFGAQMVAAFNMMTRHDRDLWTGWIGKTSTALRAGIVTHPNFLIANAVRDQATAAILYGKPFQRLIATIGGARDEILQRDAARIYAQTGGIAGGASASGLHGLVEKDLGQLARKGWAATRLTSVKGLTEVAEISETAMRVGLFKDFLKEAKARGLDEYDAALEAAWRARDHLDFDRRGGIMGGWSRLIPFLNASIQGTEKVGRHMLVPIAKKLAGEVLTAEDERALPQAVKAWAALGVLAVASAGLAAWNDRNPNYREINTRIGASHWPIMVDQSSDTFIAVPKPYELATALNAAEAVVLSWGRQDPLAWQRYRDGVVEVLMLPSLTEGNPLIKSIYEAKTNTDLFTDRALVPDHLQALEPWLQMNANNSALSKALGKALNWSPIMVDHFFLNFSGSWGRSFIALSDRASGEKPKIGWAEAVFLNRFVKDASKGASSVGAFWDLVSRSSGSFEGVWKTYRAMADGGDPSGAEAFLARQPADERAYAALMAAPAIRIGGRPASVSRVHPLTRARDAIIAIGALRRDLADNDHVKTAAGDEALDQVQRREADDILSELAMAEARNAMVAMKRPGWDLSRPSVDTGTYVRELEAAAPAAARALADRYATAKVLPVERVVAAWEEMRDRLLSEGSTADIAAIVRRAYAAGTELDGTRIKPRGKPDVGPLNEP